MQKASGLFPFVLCGVLIVLSVLLVIVGHRQGDANAIISATATARAAASAKPTPASTVAVQVTASSSAAAAAASALAKPAAAD